MESFNSLVPREVDTCATGNGYDGRLGLRISSIFVILVGSTLGAVFPVLTRRFIDRGGFFKWAFFAAKYFGSGVIAATAFIHLLAPAESALNNSCLTGMITEYSWVEGIVLMVIVVLFFVELMVMRFSNFDGAHVHDEEDSTQNEIENTSPVSEEEKRNMPGENHLGHTVTHHDVDDDSEEDRPAIEDYAAQLTAIFILEFGIIFHSIFVGLTLAVSGSEFITLYIVLTFHQTFEGLGLGARLAQIPWPANKRRTPYYLAFAFGLAAPIAIAIGLGVRKSYPPTGRTTLIVNGIFDSISAGILIYTALIELFAHEFMFSETMRKAPIRDVLLALFLLCLGALLMALLGKWA
ncbi:hypothetical protein N7495_008434 [Penicillium taxi]|uniref:uncharacterized protein n=1 Tax=Penicillium taxi TaxID=168475 RepID=UPI0025453E88|nr:uncharacterized protein N7495_008434 [Penicillium taxi]KAJ5888393.1 hypothetical protein N7495_008434 [Penicillium taxi]